MRSKPALWVEWISAGKQKDKSRQASAQLKPVCFFFKSYIDSWKVRLITSSCCSRFSRLKFTA